MIRSTRALVVRGLALRLRVPLPLAPAVVKGIADGRCCPPHSPAGNNKPHGIGVSLVSFLSARPMSVGVEALREDDAVPEEGTLRSESMSQGLEISKIGVEQEIVDALARRSIVRLFPIQGAVLEPAMKGQDLIGRAKTGTGKTLAFGIPIINHVIKENKGSRGMRPYGKRPLALVLAPTRELAKQVEKEFKESALSLMTVCVYGGTSIIMQQQQLQRGVDIAVGTPGRVIDLLERGSLNLGEVKFVVLDEADQMLRVGFAEDVEKIAGYLPAVRQSMLFSATMPDWVKNISRKYLKNPTIVDLVGENDEKLAEGIKLFSIPTVNSAKRSVLSDLIAVYGKGKKTIVFTQTKRDADDVASTLGRAHACEALHGDITQAQREKTLSGFREGRFKVLVATDVASRGLDVPNVDLVIHYEIPNDSETFVHRSGRTGRAGKEGVAILMYTLQQNRTISIIERDVGCKFEKISPPSAEEVIKSTADQAVGALQKVHPDLRGIFLPIAEKLLSEQGAGAFASALACLSGFTQPPASRSLLTHEQGWTTLRLSRPKSGLPLFTTQSVIAALAQICPSATNRVGKIQMLNEVDVQGAVFDMPESIAKELLSLQHNSSDTLDAPKQLPNIVEDIPSTSYYGRSFGGGGGFGNRPRVGPPFYGRNDSYGRPSTGDRSSGDRPSFYPPNNGTSGPRMSTPYPGGPGSSGVRMPPPPYSGGNGVNGFRMAAPYPPYPGRVADNSSSGLRPPTPYSYGSNTGTGDRVIGGSAGSFVSSLGRNGASFNEDRGGGLADFGRSLSERKFDSGVGGIGSSDSTLLNDKWNKCQLCGQPGHFARNCPTLQKS